MMTKRVFVQTYGCQMDALLQDARAVPGRAASL
jgi:hypothetical protein